MSIFLTNEELFDMPFTEAPDQRKAPHWLGNIAYVVVGAAMKVLTRYKVVNREAVRAFKGKGGVVIVANHISYLDPVFLWLAIRTSQWGRFMARDNIFDGLLGRIGSRCGAFPVKRDTADLTSVKRAAKMLKRGEPVGIFPEGTRRSKGTAELQLHAGAAMIARMGKAPLLPATARDTDKVKQKGKRLRFQKVTVIFGEPVELSWFDFLPKDDRLDGCSWYVMRECFALARDVLPEDIDMCELFPEAKDFTEVFAQHDVRAQAALVSETKSAPEAGDAPEASDVPEASDEARAASQAPSDPARLDSQEVE